MDCEVVGFQLQSVTALDIGSVDYCYVTKYPALPQLTHLPSNFPQRENQSIVLPANTAHFTSIQDHPPTWVSTVPVPTYSYRGYSTLDHILPLLATPARFLSLPLHLFFQNIFYRDPQLSIRRSLPPPRRSALLPTLVTCLLVHEDFENGPEGHPLSHRHLPPVYAYFYILGLCRLQHALCPLLLPGPS